MRGQAPRAFGAAPRFGGLLVAGRAECGNTPPAPAALPPKFGGLLGEDFGVGVRIWRPHEPHRRSRSALAQNANVQEATRPPHSGGQRRRRGGRVLTICKTFSKKPTFGEQRRRRGGACPRTLLNPQQEAPLWGAAPSEARKRGACHTLCTTCNTPPCGARRESPPHSLCAVA